MKQHIQYDLDGEKRNASVNGQYKPGDVVLGNWTLMRLIGEGSYGCVFEAKREDYGNLVNYQTFFIVVAPLYVILIPVVILYYKRKS